MRRWPCENLNFPFYLKERELSQKQMRKRMVDYEIRDLETLVVYESEDEDLEELLLLKYFE